MDFEYELIIDGEIYHVDEEQLINVLVDELREQTGWSIAVYCGSRKVAGK